MRITHRMITNRYSKSLNNLSYQLDKMNNKVVTGRAFANSSENTAAAIKGFQLRRDLARNEGYTANIEHARATLTNTESALMHLQELAQNALVKIRSGQNSTNSTGERKIVATELRNIQEQMLQTLNSTASDQYYFGGQNTDRKPFTVDGGKLHYNGYPLDLPLPPPATPADNEALAQKLASQSRSLDIGLGVRIDPITGAVDENTVFHYSIPGIQVSGHGTTDLGGLTASNNLYDLLGQIADRLETEPFEGKETDLLYGHFKEQSAGLLRNLTDVGTKTAYLDFFKDRLEIQDLNSTKRQQEVEGIDPKRVYVEFKSMDVAYNAALQMGTKIIQPSIFNFMS